MQNAAMQNAGMNCIGRMQEVLSEWQPLFARLPCHAEIGAVRSILHSESCIQFTGGELTNA